MDLMIENKFVPELRFKEFVGDWKIQKIQKLLNEVKSKHLLSTPI